MHTSEQNSDEPDRKQSDLAEGELDTVEESIRIHEQRDEKTEEEKHGAQRRTARPRSGA